MLQQRDILYDIVEHYGTRFFSIIVKEKTQDSTRNCPMSMVQIDDVVGPQQWEEHQARARPSDWLTCFVAMATVCFLPAMR